MVIIISIILGICIFIILWFFIIPWLFGAPYDISRKHAMQNIVELTNPKQNDLIAELGSGDGRICIALTKQNNKTKIHGFEINPFLVLISRRKIRKENLQKQIKIFWTNFWKVNLSKYNKIIFFQFNSITSRLEKKFEKELQKNTKVISHNWKLPNWRIKKTLGNKGLIEGEVYLYEK